MRIVEMCSRDHEVEAFVYFTDTLLADNKYLKMGRLNQRKRFLYACFKHITTSVTHHIHQTGSCQLLISLSSLNGNLFTRGSSAKLMIFKHELVVIRLFVDNSHIAWR